MLIFPFLHCPLHLSTSGNILHTIYAFPIAQPLSSIDNLHRFLFQSHRKVNKQQADVDIVRNTIPNLSAESLAPYTYIILCTKSTPDIPPTVVDIVTPALPKDNTETTLLLLQNGLHIHRPFFASHPNTTVLSGISMIGSEEVGKGVIVQDEGDKLIVGAFENPNIEVEQAREAARDFVMRYGAAGKTECT